MHRKSLFGFLLVPFLLVLGPGLIGGASAAPSYCQSGAMCGYTGADFTGSVGNVFANNTSLSFSPWNSVDSVYNNGNYCSVTFFSGTGYTGYSQTLGIGWSYTDLASQNSTFYHNINSNYWC